MARARADGTAGAAADRWLLVDGSSFIFRAFHGVPQSVRSPDGRPVNAVRGFLDTLARVVTERSPTRLAVAADWDWRPAWRVELVPSYKAHRVAEPVPPALEPQMPVIDEVLAAVGVDSAGVADHEAEDVIATWAARISGPVEVLSGDRDLFGIVEDGRVTVLYPEKSGLTPVSAAEVSRRYGIPGSAYCDFAVLRGDPSDGLPGLRGVGPVAAAGLIARHGSLEGLLASGALTDAQAEYIRRARRVVLPVDSLDVVLPEGRRAGYPVDAVTLAGLVERHGIRSSVERLVAALSARLATAPQ